MQPRSTDAIAASMIRNLESRTGLCLDEWIEIVAAECPAVNGSMDGVDPAKPNIATCAAGSSTTTRSAQRPRGSSPPSPCATSARWIPARTSSVDEQYSGRYAAPPGL